MNQLQVFENKLFKVTAKIINGEPSFDVEQVAKSLGLTQSKGSSVFVRWERVNNYLPKNSPVVGKGDFIPEPLVYKLAFKAANDIAEKFQDWLAIEVIPSIRKTGSYQVGPNDLVTNYLSMSEEDRAIAFFNSQKEKKQIEQQRQEELPYTNFGKAVSNSSAAINIGAFSKLMYDEHGIRLGRNKMFQWLRDNGFLIKSGRERNQPKQQFIEQGLFTTTVTMVSRTEGDVESVTTLVTGKGQIKLSNKLISEFSTLNQRGVI
ncbi:phage antirepressor KilAC domain-containing protein [Oceanobacillus sp. FSL W7-1293]